MEVRGSGGGCCIVRYGHNPNYYNYSPNYDLSKMDRIMLRFRPIAPKPIPGGGPLSTGGALNDDVKAGPGRGKRRNGTASTASKGGGKRRKPRSPDHHDNKKLSDGEAKCHVVTLPLLPETPDLVSPRMNQGPRSAPMWLSFRGDDQEDQIASEQLKSSRSHLVCQISVGQSRRFKLFGKIISF